MIGQQLDSTVLCICVESWTGSSSLEEPQDTTYSFWQDVGGYDKWGSAVQSYKHKWCRVGRLQLSHCECVRVFQAIMLGEMWKTQSPPVSMETPSLSQAERQSPSTFRIRGVNYSTLFNAHIITLILSTTDSNISMKIKINTAAAWRLLIRSNDIPDEVWRTV